MEGIIKKHNNQQAALNPESFPKRWKHVPIYKIRNLHLSRDQLNGQEPKRASVVGAVAQA
jgi:hypothetical protein